MRPPTSIVRTILAAVPALAFLQPAAAQLKVGDDAPAITLAEWLNVEAGKEPTLASLQGRVVMLEFWGTWCGPCVRAMPEVQKLHDRYSDRGLTVLAISYETANVMKTFLKEGSYTMPVGSDPEKKVVSAYAIRGWPTTYVIGKDGKIAHIGSPYDAEAAVELALGLETSPAPLLTAWLDAQKGSKDDQQQALARLQEKASPDFDLRAWACANGGAEAAVATPADGAAAPAPAEAAAPAAKPVDGADALRKLAALWHQDAVKRQEALQQLGKNGPTSFDLVAFVREAFGKAFPLELKELQALLKGQKFTDALDAITSRNPAAPVLAAAAKDAGLKGFCRNKLEETRAMARKGIMAQRWVFAGVQVKDNEGFWKDLAVSGIGTSPDKKQVTAIMLGGASVEKAKVEGFIQSHFARAFAMDALSGGKAPVLKDLAKDVEKERASVQKSLDARYGAPEKPRGKKDGAAPDKKD